MPLLQKVLTCGSDGSFVEKNTREVREFIVSARVLTETPAQRTCKGGHCGRI